MSLKPEQVSRTWLCPKAAARVNRDAKRAAARKRRRLEKTLLDDTPRRVTRGWAD